MSHFNGFPDKFKGTRPYGSLINSDRDLHKKISRVPGNLYVGFNSLCPELLFVPFGGPLQKDITLRGRETLTHRTHRHFKKFLLIKVFLSLNGYRPLPVFRAQRTGFRGRMFMVLSNRTKTFLNPPL